MSLVGRVVSPHGGGTACVAFLGILVGIWGAGAAGREDVQTDDHACVEVVQGEGQVHFEFLRIEPSGRRAVPAKAYRLEVRAQRSPVWLVEGENYASADRITYGAAPAGFVQKIPPIALIRGVKYEAHARMRDAGGFSVSFVYQGRDQTPRCRLSWKW